MKESLKGVVVISVVVALLAITAAYLAGFLTLYQTYETYKGYEIIGRKGECTGCTWSVYINPPGVGGSPFFDTVQEARDYVDKLKCSDGTLNGQCSVISRNNYCWTNGIDLNPVLSQNTQKCVNCTEIESKYNDALQFYDKDDDGYLSDQEILKYIDDYHLTTLTIAFSNPEGTAMNDFYLANCKLSKITAPVLLPSQTVTCSDGTANFVCSNQKPSYCYDGNLLNRASFCGCPSGYTVSGNDCAYNGVVVTQTSPVPTTPKQSGSGSGSGDGNLSNFLENNQQMIVLGILVFAGIFLMFGRKR